MNPPRVVIDTNAVLQTLDDFSAMMQAE